MKAKAAIFWEVGKKLDIQEVDVEKPHAGEVLVKLAAAGICHSDYHVMTGHLLGPSLRPSSATKAPGWSPRSALG